MRSLPIPVHPREDESGLGLCLRALARSRLSLNWMRHELQLNARCMPHDQQMTALACLLGVEESVIRERMVRQEKAGASRWICGPHHGLFGNHVRVSWPQICPRCVHEQGYCRWVWDLALVTCCSVHRCRLVDRCKTCDARLRWDRPQTDICRCKHPLGGRFEPAQEEAKALSELVAVALQGASATSLLARNGLPAFVGGLSVAGLTMLVQAFGDLPKAFSGAKATAGTRACSTPHWHEVAVRATQRLRAFDAGADVEPFVNAALLRRLAREGASPLDRRIGSALLREFGDKSEGSQLDLFEEGGAS
jgi:hypothetical protein